MFISLPGDDLRTSLRLLSDPGYYVFSVFIYVFVAIKIKFKPKAWMSSNFGQMSPLTAELAALEPLKNNK